MLSRRAFVGKLAAGAAVACAAGMGRAEAMAVRGEVSSGTDFGKGVSSFGPESQMAEAKAPESELSTPPWELLRPLTVGSVVAHGWRVTELSGVVDGSCVLTLANQRGRAQRVHLCRNDGHPQGLVYTKGFDLVVMNGGRGDLPTEETFAQAVVEVAHVVAANEDLQEPVAAALLPHAQRVNLFASAAKLR